MQRVAAIVVSLVVLCLFAAPGEARRRGSSPLVEKVTLRVRVVAMEPERPVRIRWRWGGEGLGGDPVGGYFPVVSPNTKLGPSVTDLADSEAMFKWRDKEDGGLREERDYFVESGKTDTYWIKPRAWTHPMPLSELRRGTSTFLTVTLQPMSAPKQGRIALRNVVIEFQFAYGRTILKTFRETGPDGPTAGIYLATSRLGSGKQPAPEFAEETCGLLEYAARRAKLAAAFPWAGQPAPKRFAFLTDCAGYRTGAGYKVRTTNKQTLLNELEALQYMGVNGLRGASPFVSEMIQTGTGIGPSFSRARILHGMGYPIQAFESERPGDTAKSCPYNPPLAERDAVVRQAAEKRMKDYVGKLPVGECWLLTVDEIGSVFGRTPEGKEHMGCCPHCIAAFQEYVKRSGVTLDDFGAKSWDDIRPTYGYWAKTYAERKAAEDAAQNEAARMMTKNAAKALAALIEARSVPAGDTEEADHEDDVVDKGDDEVSEPAPAKERDARKNAVSQPTPPMPPHGWALLRYYSGRFNCDTSARMFAAQRQYFDEQNAFKQKALDEGRLDAPEARQPFVYSYALRGNSFLMGGHSLDFFNFYRQADNGFMYETSNRDARVWQWDSYLCAVGRTLHDKMGKRFGVYVKPHRGAPIQRALTAIGQQCTLIYWYTYGPNWSKGDSYSSRPAALAATSRAAHLVGAAEDVLYGAERERPARIAVVRPRTSHFFQNAASWENGKWVYTALMHSQLAMDAIDEGLIESEDLSRYKAIYISGSHLRRASAARLAEWVERGGVLYTSAWGLARNESDLPLAELQPVLGLKTRPDLQMWSEVRRYGATSLAGFKPLKDSPTADADARSVTGTGVFAGGFTIVVGREPLDPAPDTEVLAKFGDGEPALTRRAYGKGCAYVVGFYPGLEYSADVLKADFDMARDFHPAKRAFMAAPALDAGIAPVVEVDAPCIEAILLRHPDSGKRSLILINWAYRIADPEHPATPRAPLEAEGTRRPLALPGELQVTVRDAGAVTAVRSTWSGKLLSSKQEGGAVTITVPRLEEADILTFE